MGSSLIDRIISELSNELKEKYPDFLGIYLYGSQARGDHNEDSDYDLALVFERKRSWRERDSIQRIVTSYDIKYLVFLDAWIFAQSDLKRKNTPLRENIIKEGIYYAA